MKYLTTQNIILALAALLVITSYVNQKVISRPIPPKTFPEFSMYTLNGAEIDNSDFIASPFTVVNFFASWCMPCHAEHPTLMRMSEETDLPLYGFALSDEKDNTRRFLQKLGNPYTAVIMDENKDIHRKLGLSGIPVTLILDQDQKVIWSHQGPITPRLYENEFYPFIKDNIPERVAPTP